YPVGPAAVMLDDFIDDLRHGCSCCCIAILRFAKPMPPTAPVVETILFMNGRLGASQCRSPCSRAGTELGDERAGRGDGVGVGRSIDGVRGVHRFRAEVGGRVLHQGDVVAELHLASYTMCPASPYRETRRCHPVR